MPFRDAFKDCVITDVTAEAAEKFVYKNPAWNATTRATVIRHLSVLFNFAVGRGYVTMNPFTSIQKPKKAASNSKDKVLTVKQVIELLQNKHDYRSECAALVLVLFCGVRVDEVHRVTWAPICLRTDFAVIS